MKTGMESRKAQSFHQTAPKSSLDLATFLGIAAAISLILLAIFLGGSATAFVNIPAILIVIGGTLGITTACFSFGDMGDAFIQVRRAFIYQHKQPAGIAEQLLILAQTARKEGLLALQKHLEPIQDLEGLVQGLSVVLDGNSAEEAEKVMQQEFEAMWMRQHRTINILRKAAELAPAMGLIGTLVGLVQMLTNLDNPENIGPAMAVALLTTFYGACLANLFFIPLAAKIERNVNAQTLLHSLLIMTSASIARQESPRRLEMLLNTLLPPSERVDFFQ